MTDVLFKKVDYTLKKLIEDIDIGEIGLPDIQRPFVWKPAKVRDLFDSMYRGYPIGYLLLWENGYTDDHRTIGINQKQKNTPRLLIVDGQQRLTSLYAVIKAVPVVRKNFSTQQIRIAFHPQSEKFEVANASIDRNVEWIPDISVLWSVDTNTYGFITEFLNRLSTHTALSERERQHIANSITRLEKILDYPMTSLEVSSSVDEDQIAEIFVRINSKGTPLNQSNFILTLMSVFWDEGRTELEKFCQQAKIPPQNKVRSPYNHLFRPDPDQLLRVSVALGFRRARLEHVYSLLRGKDLQTKEFSVEQREKQFAILKNAQIEVLNLQHWHEFIKALIRAGYINRDYISSQVAVIYTYAFWLIGKRDFQVEMYQLRETIARWFFMVTLTSRYTGSTESTMESDLALLRNAETPSDFIQILEQQIDTVFTRDYWQVTLPNELHTSSSRNTGLFAYYASLCLLDAKALYSRLTIARLLDPTTRAKKSNLERHHLFPRDYLKKQGIRERSEINQIANMAYVEWYDNIAISNRPPSEYVPEIEERFRHEELTQMYKHHALWEGWYEWDYFDFLEERRKRMAAVIRDGYKKLYTQALDNTH